MFSKDFAQCASRSLLASKLLSRNGLKTEVHFGLFMPDTPKDSWDIRWRNHDVFTHFWVSDGLIIYDCSTKQFGYPSSIRTHITDERYTIIGFMDQVTLKLEQIATDFIIDWSSYLVVEGTPKIVAREI